MEIETPAARLHFMKTSSFTCRTFTQQRACSRWGSGLISLFEPWALKFTLCLSFSSFFLTAGNAEDPPAAQQRGKKKTLITLSLRHLFFPSLHLLLEKLSHNSTHYIHSEDEKEHTCPLLLWKSIQPFIAGCNSTHLIQKHILTLLSYMKGHHGCPFNSITSHIFLSMKYLLIEEKNNTERVTVT